MSVGVTLVSLNVHLVACETEIFVGIVKEVGSILGRGLTLLVVVFGFLHEM